MPETRLHALRQVAKLLAAEAAGAPASAPEPGAAAGAALAAELSAPAAAPPQGGAADTDPAVMADALQRAGEGFAKAAADATASVSGAFADAAHALGLPAGAGGGTGTNASYVQAGQPGSLARERSSGAPPAAAEVTGEALQATGGTGVPPGGTEVQPPAAAPAVGPGGTTTGVHQYLGGALTVVDPQPFVYASARIISTLNAAVGTLSFVNFSPCVLVNGQAGIAAYAVGAVVEPTLIYIAPEGFSVASVGLSISPTAIAIGPGRSKTLAEGFAIAPTLISVAPVVDTDAQIGKDISGTPGKVVTLQRKPGDEPKATAGPGGAADQGQDEDEDASIVPRGARTGR